MIKKILIITAIITPFLMYYISIVLIKKTPKQWPVIKLAFASLLLLLAVLLFYRFANDAPAGLQYTPPKLENGKVISPKLN
jgi:RsiW-degrading membrane proteinase PrsW (M82 family)